MTRTHRILIGVVVAGAVVIAAIGFAGSYAAVRDLAEKKGFGDFAPFFPIGIDAGIVVLLALDLLLTWIRIPFPLLRQTAWLLTAATIAFNGAAAWPDPLGVGMHAVIPVLFVVSVEAARHAVGRIADITADKHMEGVRISRWLLAFPSTFRLWRRMKLWELRSYDQVIRMEQDRLVYEARLRARYGRSWKRRAPVEALMPLRLARYGVPLAETGPAGLAAAGIEPQLLPGRSTGEGTGEDTGQGAGGGAAAAVRAAGEPAGEVAAPEKAVPELAPPARNGTRDRAGDETPAEHGVVPREWEAPVEPDPGPEQEPSEAAVPAAPAPAYAAEAAPARAEVTVPVSQGRRRPMGQPAPGGTRAAYAYSVLASDEPVPPPPEPEDAGPLGIPDGALYTDVYYRAYRDFVAEHGGRPNARQLARVLHDEHGVTNAEGGLLSESHLRMYLRDFKDRYNDEMGLGG
ncbi:DUF2637 domain-containing protein [Streptomyces sp. TRM 70361]|uniref:DUF2637 domain-containing protein n=1 Tax=Streptomyces sp. TRM 70361 TaxID=3116553 RepID=UPI002E7BFB51|nr:DUF2637 domain-containing protein [Streptomyces sp. TRM 70361]MEE1940400.1 DUF2637 domain-containing protein [Streptomyces sp. TRM 70361]